MSQFFTGCITLGKVVGKSGKLLQENANDCISLLLQENKLLGPSDLLKK